jgi:hypothetical protein
MKFPIGFLEKPFGRTPNLGLKIAFFAFFEL